ncbi:MAG: hypothetical protein AB7G06_04080 [Bdellovibrionales bacterium]
MNKLPPHLQIKTAMLVGAEFKLERGIPQATFVERDLEAVDTSVTFIEFYLDSQITGDRSGKPPHQCLQHTQINLDHIHGGIDFLKMQRPETPPDILITCCLPSGLWARDVPLWYNKFIETNPKLIAFFGDLQGSDVGMDMSNYIPLEGDKGSALYIRPDYYAAIRPYLTSQAQSELDEFSV